MESIPTFCEREKKILIEGDLSSPLRILKNDNYQDSLILSSKCDSVDVKEHYLKHLITRLFTTVSDEHNAGVGIAAPQVGISKRVFLAQRTDKEGQPFEYYINPSILWYSKLKFRGEEGCLSIDNVTGHVYRSNAILLSFYTLEGENVREMIEGFPAVIVQHEYDHLNGVLFTDRVRTQSKLTYVDASEEKAFFYEMDK